MVEMISINGFFEFQKSAMQPIIVRKRPLDEVFPLTMLYQEGA